MANSLRPVESATLQADESRLIESLRIARSSTTMPERNRYTKALMASINADRPTCVRQLLALLRDAFERGGDQADLLGVGDTINAIVSAWYEEKSSGEELRFEDVHIAEETTEGPTDVTETILAHTKTPGAAQAYLRASRKHRLAVDQLDRCAERILRQATA